MNVIMALVVFWDLITRLVHERYDAHMKMHHLTLVGLESCVFGVSNIIISAIFLEVKILGNNVP